MTTPAVTASGRAEPGSGFTAHVVAEVSKLSSLELSKSVRERVRHAVLDWLGVTIAGAQQPSARIARDVLKAEGGEAVARVPGTPDRLTARQAALAVGIAGHALDYDDMGKGGHPSVVVLPAVFAVADELGVDGRTTVDGLLCGYQAMSTISAGCGPAQYARGFHSTSTFGAFAAAMGAGRLLNLDSLLLQRALGIAGTQASGLKANFGTMSKHLNAGNAAAVGVLSARLAEAGYTGATDVIESPQGFAAAHNEVYSDFDPSRPGTTLADGLAIEQIMFKLHAACGGTHSTIEGIRSAKAQRPFTVDEIDEVELSVSERTPEVCGIPEPRTGLEGMFSLRHAAALALVGSHTGPSAFTDARVNDRDMVALRDRVKVVPVARIPGVGSPTEVSIRLTSGETLRACVDPLVPTPDERLGEQRANLESKFRDLVDPILGVERSTELIELVRRIDELDSIRELTDRTATKE